MKVSRKELEKSFKKDLVGDAAYELFGRNFYDQVSMDEIAQEAEFGKATLYKLFSSKEEILIYIICRGIDQLCRQLEELYQNTSDPNQALERLVELEYDFYTGYSNLVLALLFRPTDDERQAAYVSQIREKHQYRTELAEKIISTARAKGVSLQISDQDLARAIETTMKGFMVNRIERQSTSPDRESDLKFIKTLLWYGFIGQHTQAWQEEG